MGKCWHRRQPEPLDLRGLHRAAHELYHQTTKYQSLVPNEKDAVVTTPENPQQAEIDADVASITGDLNVLSGIFTSLQTLVTNAQNGNVPVSTTALAALVTQGADVTNQYQGLVLPAPTPTPAPTPAPSPDPTPSPTP